MPRVNGSLVTDADLNGVYPPKAGYTPTGDASRILSGDIINARYTVNGAPNDTRCPSWDQLSTAATTAPTTWAMSLMGAMQSKSYMVIQINAVNHINTASGSLSGTTQLPPGNGLAILTQGTAPYCSIEIYDTTGGGRVYITGGQASGNYSFTCIAGKNYDIQGYAGTGIPLTPTQKKKSKQK